MASAPPTPAVTMFEYPPLIANLIANRIAHAAGLRGPHPHQPPDDRPAQPPSPSTPPLPSRPEFFMAGIVPITDTHDGDCKICTQALASGAVQVVKIVKCDHAFHGKCLLIWLHGPVERNRKCPVCLDELFCWDMMSLPLASAPRAYETGTEVCNLTYNLPVLNDTNGMLNLGVDGANVPDGNLPANRLFDPPFNAQDVVTLQQYHANHNMMALHPVAPPAPTQPRRWPGLGFGLGFGGRARPTVPVEDRPPPRDGLFSLQAMASGHRANTTPYPESGMARTPAEVATVPADTDPDIRRTALLCAGLGGLTVAGTNDRAGLAAGLERTAVLAPMDLWAPEQR